MSFKDKFIIFLVLTWLTYCGAAAYSVYRHMTELQEQMEIMNEKVNRRK